MTIEPRRAPTLLALVGLAAGLAVGAAGITLLNLGVGSLMQVGGRCGSSGSTASATPCPSGSDGMLIGLLLVGVSYFVAGVFGSRVGGFWSSTSILAWAGLFMSLGWNFLSSGISGAYDVASGLLLGGMFLVMGGVPLVYTVASGVRGGDGAPAVTGDPGLPTAPSASRVTERAEPAIHDPDAGDRPDVAALSAHLESLARLHAEGQLDDAEYAAAKASILKALEGNQ